MKDFNNEFLERYKELEQKVKIIGYVDIYDFESSDEIDKINPAYKSRLYACRTTRNFLSHNSDSSGFLKATPETINFLKELIKYCDNKVLKAKDVCVSPSRSKYFAKDCALSDLVLLLTKQNRVYILDENKHLIGEINKDVILNTIAQDKSLKRTKASSVAVKPDVLFVSKDKPMCEIEQDCIVTSDGKDSGVVVGIIIR